MSNREEKMISSTKTLCYMNVGDWMKFLSRYKICPGFISRASSLQLFNSQTERVGDVTNPKGTASVFLSLSLLLTLLFYLTLSSLSCRRFLFHPLFSALLPSSLTTNSAWQMCVSIEDHRSFIHSIVHSLMNPEFPSPTRFNGLGVVSFESFKSQLLEMSSMNSKTPEIMYNTKDPVERLVVLLHRFDPKGTVRLGN